MENFADDIMKVTVCFGKVKVVVPCGDGVIRVGNLQEKACMRYRRAIGKTANYYVNIVKLENAADGGILDIDDMVSDVVEDKEKLIAIFEEEKGHCEYDSVISLEEKSSSHHSSANQTRLNSSNELEQRYLSVDKHDGQDNRNSSVEKLLDYEAANSDTHLNGPANETVGISGQFEQSCVSTQNQLDSLETYETLNSSSMLVKGARIAISPEPNAPRRLRNEHQHFHHPIRNDLHLSPTPEEAYSTSVSSTHHGRSALVETDANPQLNLAMWLHQNSKEVIFVNDGNIETIRVKECLSSDENVFIGLVVKAITQKSPVTHSDPLTCHDVIIGINEHLLLDYNFKRAESILMQSMSRSHICFRVLKHKGPELSQTLNVQQRDDAKPLRHSRPLTLCRNSKHPGSKKRISDSSTSPTRAPVPLTRKSSRDPKKIGQQISLQLVKESQGLGFSLASKDSVMGDPGPMYIQQILPTGAAMKSGKILIGDRLLEVNGVSTFGKTQDDVVGQLRNISVGSTVNITVGRMTDNLPRKMVHVDPEPSHMTTNEQLKEYMTFDIALNDTGSAGLGISLKGNQNTVTCQDLGVFVKGVFNGGAAWQDGRLQANDQLIRVNGHTLLGMSNQNAIEVLKTSMFTEGNIRGMIELMIARRKNATELPSTSRASSSASSDMSDLITEQRSSSRLDSPQPLHVKQSSLTSILRETSFGPDEFSDVTSYTCSAVTLGATGIGSLAHVTSTSSPVFVHSPSNSSTVEMNTLDAELVSQARQKIFASSSSSSNLIGNLLNSSLSSSVLNRPNPTNNAYATWTIPRKNRGLNRSTSWRTNMNGEEAFYFLTGEGSELQSSHQGSELGEVSARLLNPLPPTAEEDRTRKPPSNNRSSSSLQNKENIDCTNSTANKRNVPSNKEINNSTVGNVKLRKFKSDLAFGSLVQRSSFRRSLSNESLATLNKQTTNEKSSHGDSKTDVGPCLGIAKSSSLESLQTAVEACIAEQNQDPTIPKSLPKSVRGRVLNDSFRAALNRSYDLSQPIPTLKPMNIAQSNEVDQNTPPIVKSWENPSKSNKKKNRFLSIFKPSKNRKQDYTLSNTERVVEEEQRKSLENQREIDFARMKEEKERIQIKVKELRTKQAAEKKDKSIPNETTTKNDDDVKSPNTAVQRRELQEFYLKENKLNTSTVDLSATPATSRSVKDDAELSRYTNSRSKNRKRSKSDNNRKFKEATAAYNSLPRQPRRPSKESWDGSWLDTFDKSSIHPIDNRDYYNRHKPISPIQPFGQLYQTLNNRTSKTVEEKAHMHPRHIKKNPDVLQTDFENDKGEQPKSVGQLKNLTNGNASESNFLRKKSSSNPKHNQPVRHSIYTDQPSTFSKFDSNRGNAVSTANTTDLSRRYVADNMIWLSSTAHPEGSASSLESNKTASSSGLGVSERSRRYAAEQNLPSDKIEVSLPCNL